MGFPLTFHGVPAISKLLAPLRRCLFPQGPSSHCPINGATVPAMSSVPHTGVGSGSNGIIWENAQDLPRAERGFLGETGRHFGVSVSRPNPSLISEQQSGPPMTATKTLTDRESELTYARDAFRGMEAGEPRIAVILMPLPDMRRILPRVIGS